MATTKESSRVYWGTYYRAISVQDRLIIHPCSMYNFDQKYEPQYNRRNPFDAHLSDSPMQSMILVRKDGSSPFSSSARGRAFSSQVTSPISCRGSTPSSLVRPLHLFDGETSLIELTSCNRILYWCDCSDGGRQIGLHLWRPVRDWFGCRFT